MVPLKFNDGRDVPAELSGAAVLEVIAYFGGATYESQPIEGHWVHNGIHYRDNHAKLIVDVPETKKNRQWMRDFKARWKGRLDQVELWMVHFGIEVE
jgi:hypothetical protein